MASLLLAHGLQRQAEREQPSFLDYFSCNLEELRKFIKDRGMLGDDEYGKLRYWGKARLANRLIAMDQSSTFLRFLDLPPELRLWIYRELLVVDNSRTGKVHAALLRTSRLIHKEAKPVLYGENKFSVWSGISKGAHAYSRSQALQFTHVHFPGHDLLYEESELTLGGPTTILGFNTLREVQHLTIHLGLPTSFWAKESRRAVACLGLMLSGTSKIKHLTFIIRDWPEKDRDSLLAVLSWSAALLQADVHLLVKSDGEEISGLYSKVQAAREYIISASTPGLRSPGDLIVTSRQQARRMLDKHPRHILLGIESPAQTILRYLVNLLMNVEEVHMESVMEEWKRFNAYVEAADGGFDNGE